MPSIKSKESIAKKDILGGGGSSWFLCSNPEWVKPTSTSALGWARAAVTRAQLGNIDFCVSDGGKVEMKYSWWRLAPDADWQSNPLFFVVRLTLVRSFLAFSSLSISTFWALAGGLKAIMSTDMNSQRTSKRKIKRLTESFIVRVFRPGVRIEHIFWVVGSQFIYSAELNELLVNTENKEELHKSRTVHLLSRVADSPCVRLTVWVHSPAELHTLGF